MAFEVKAILTKLGRQWVSRMLSGPEVTGGHALLGITNFGLATSGVDNGFFIMGEGGYTVVSGVRQPKDPSFNVLGSTVEADGNTFGADDGGVNEATFFPVTQMGIFKKDLTTANITITDNGTFFEVKVNIVVAIGEANSIGSPAHAPTFCEVGLFAKPTNPDNSRPYMVAYGTFPPQFKDGTISFNHNVRFNI